jgi:hypothetical protein
MICITIVLSLFLNLIGEYKYTSDKFKGYQCNITDKKLEFDDNYYYLYYNITLLSKNIPKEYQNTNYSKIYLRDESNQAENFFNKRNINVTFSCVAKNHIPYTIVYLDDYNHFFALNNFDNLIAFIFISLLISIMTYFNCIVYYIYCFHKPHKKENKEKNGYQRIL